ncbi:MAG: recombinase RecA [Leptospiraceae bacterium]|nr:recombinase RecA [Leptospiraceae bacterium]MCB1320730.1 recombinase RecA [Leptospiraceae bacterium]
MAKSKKAESKVVSARAAAASGEGRDQKERQQAVNGAIQQIERQFGKGSIMKLGDSGVQQGIGYIPTGALTLDFALGLGGLPRGRVVEVFGPESSGKTTLCLSTVANAQKQGGIAAFVDAEHALDPLFARTLGVNIDDLLVAQPDNGEEALEITESLVRSNAVDIVIVDSVAALVPRAELEGNMGDAQMGLHARLMSQALRKLTGTISRSNTTVVFVNQIRHKIGVMFGSPETTTGGNALKFYASVRMDIRRIETLKKSDEAFGNRVRVKIVKNKVAPPFRQAEFDILFNKGINREGCILDLAVNANLIERSGTWYSYGATRIGQGRENACTFLLENAEVTTEIETELRKQHEASRSLKPVDEVQGKLPEDEKSALKNNGATRATAGKASRTEQEQVVDGVDPETGEILSNAG